MDLLALELRMVTGPELEIFFSLGSHISNETLRYVG